MEDDDMHDSTDNDDIGYSDHKVNSKASKSKADAEPERFHYIPFGAGTRRCIGSQFAKVFLKVLIIELCTMCRWKMLNENPKIRTAPLPFPADGLPLVFTAVEE